MPSIFLCHSHKDKPFARMLSERLQSHGIRTWIDEAEMQIGDSLIAKIEMAIQKFDYLGIILSPDSVLSEWVQREVQIALIEEIQGKRVKVLPILHKKCDIPKFLVTKVYADLSENFEEGWGKILERLTSDLNTEKYKQKRIYEILQANYQDWVSFGEKEYQFLSSDTIELIIQHLFHYKISLSLLKYLFCSIAFLSTWEGLEVSKLRVLLLKIEKSDALDLFSFLLRHPNFRVRIGSAKLALHLAQLQALDILMECLQQENDYRVKRVYVRSIYHLGKHLPKELAHFLIENDDDWLIQSYALLSLDEHRACLLISDGAHFAAELGTIAEEAGFKIITLSQSLPLLEMEKVEDEILKAYELVLLVRGEHYGEGMFSGFYKKIKHFVSEGGTLFATSWTSWETRNLWNFVDVLPFAHVGSGFKEDLAITCNITESELAQKVHFTRTTYRASFEILRTKESSTVLLQADDGIPLFGYHQYEAGFCYYLNTCQHSCFSDMQSPLQTSPDLRSFLKTIFEWIYTVRDFH